MIVIFGVELILGDFGSSFWIVDVGVLFEFMGKEDIWKVKMWFLGFVSLIIV